MGMRAGLTTIGRWKEVRDIGRDPAVQGNVTQTLKEVARIVHPGLREPLALVGAQDPEELRPLRLEKVAHVLAEDQSDACEIAECRHHASRFKLGQKAGGKTGVPAKFHQAHLFALAQVLDAVADALVLDKGFGGFRRNAAGLGGLPVVNFHGAWQYPERELGLSVGNRFRAGSVSRQSVSGQAGLRGTLIKGG